jgi:hypothetical protein
MSSHHLQRDLICPHCAKVCDGATNAGPDDHPPKDGDLNICLECQGVSEYKAGALVGLAQSGIDALPTYVLKDIKKAQMILRAIKSQGVH